MVLLKYKPKTKPFKHQARATIRAVKARNYAIFFEPRLGKSKAALDYAGILALAGHIQRVLILGPRITLEVWERQLEQHYPFPYYAETFDEYWDSGQDYMGTTLKFPNGVVIDMPQFFLAGREETMVKRHGERPGSRLRSGSSARASGRAFPSRPRARVRSSGPTTRVSHRPRTRARTTSAIEKASREEGFIERSAVGRTPVGYTESQGLARLLCSVPDHGR